MLSVRDESATEMSPRPRCYRTRQRRDRVTFEKMRLQTVSTAGGKMTTEINMGGDYGGKGGRPPSPPKKMFCLVGRKRKCLPAIATSIANKN